jgi:hypothetical protein
MSLLLHLKFLFFYSYEKDTLLNIYIYIYIVNNMATSKMDHVNYLNEADNFNKNQTEDTVYIHCTKFPGYSN